MNLHTYTEILPNGFSFPMRRIPGGVFDMGSKEGDTDIFDTENPQRIDVKVSEFYLATYAVVQLLWKSVMNNNPSRFLGEERPVENVSWYDANEFIQALNAATNMHRKEHGLGGYRLPTEAEWEYAARGGPLNDRYLFTGSDKLLEVGWFEDNSDDETHEVGLLMANQLGLYDMSGNVWEWVEDYRHDNYKAAPANAHAWLTNPTSNHRMLRGGSYFNGARLCRVASRYSNAPAYRYGGIGFRLALSAV